MASILLSLSGRQNPKLKGGDISNMRYALWKAYH